MSIRTCTALLAVTLLPAIGSGCGAGVNISSGSSSSSSVDGVNRETRDQTYREPIRRLVLDSDAGAVALSTGPDGQVDVQQRLEWTDPKPDVTAAVQGDTLRITARCPRGTVQVNRRCQVAFTIRLPTSTAVEAKVGAGGIRATGLAGDQKLDSSAGGVTGSELRSDVVNAVSNAGGVELRFVEPPRTVTVESRAGGVEVLVPRDGERYRVQAETSAGGRSIDVATDPSSARSIDVSSNAGSVSVGYS